MAKEFKEGIMGSDPAQSSVTRHLDVMALIEKVRGLVSLCIQLPAFGIGLRSIARRLTWNVVDYSPAQVASAGS